MTESIRAKGGYFQGFGGAYEKPDEQMMEVWRVGVEETREALEEPWP